MEDKSKALKKNAIGILLLVLLCAFGGSILTKLDSSRKPIIQRDFVISTNQNNFCPTGLTTRGILFGLDITICSNSMLKHEKFLLKNLNGESLLEFSNETILATVGKNILECFYTKSNGDCCFISEKLNFCC